MNQLIEADCPKRRVRDVMLEKGLYMARHDVYNHEKKQKTYSDKLGDVVKLLREKHGKLL